MHGVRSGLLYPKYWLYRCNKLQCMCGGLWGYRVYCEHFWVYGMYGGQLQDQRRQCSMYCVLSGLLYPKYWLYRCYELQCMCGGIRG